MVWRIYYADGSTVEVRDCAEWRAAPDDGVQVVVLLGPVETPRWCYSGGPVRDRRLWTGEDVYDPFGWGVKHGSLIGDAAYLAIWERACADPAG